jgi:hypothetical protein
MENKEDMELLRFASIFANYVVPTGYTYLLKHPLTIKSPLICQLS